MGRKMSIKREKEKASTNTSAVRGEN